MPLFNDLGKKLSATTQNVVRGTKELADTAKLNSQISDENKQIANLYSQIGKQYYESSEADAETPLGKLCLAINEAKERIAKLEAEILEIKGVKRCPSCGADIPPGTAFCGACGTKA